jgi:hypothetical protein
MQAASSAGQADANALRMQLAGAQALCRKLELEVADAQVLPAPCRILWSTPCTRLLKPRWDTPLQKHKDQGMLPPSTPSQVPLAQ